MRRSFRTVLLAGLPCLVLRSAFGAPAPEATPAAIEAIVVSSRLEGLRWPRFPDYQYILKGLYGPRAYAPLWLDAGRPTKQARDAIDVLREGDTKGLDPGDYDAALLEGQWREISGGKASSDELARFDVALSVGLLRNISDLHIGKVNPKNLAFGFDIDPKKYDLAELVAGAIRDDRIRPVVTEAEPHYIQNHLLKEQLAHYKRLAEDSSVGPVEITSPLRPGAPLATAPQLARWLVALGDLPAVPDPPSANYEGSLVDGVKHFQARHGLPADGVIGAPTAHALSVPASQRVHQIELALERLRWVPPLEQGRVVFVNIPAFELWAFDDLAASQGPALEMRVVVGRAMRTQTPIFTGVMKTVVFAPYWNVPTSITRKEILPKLRSNPGYLAAQDMEIVSDGTPLSPSSSNIAKLASGGAQLRQRPGPKNALGRVKFLFPNSNNVYLHDTPAQSVFDKTRRDFSHGCIRLAQPASLAEWVLRDEGGWDTERVAQEMARTTEKAVPLRKPIPVAIFYTTVIARRDGTVAFFEDIYGHDKALERALAAGYPYPP
jgi:murein L,D-transpeptidase YcbB/YkuD